MAKVDIDRIATLRDVRRIVAGQVMIYHVGNLAKDRAPRGRPVPDIDRKANVALSHAKKGRAALVQCRLGKDQYEYRIIATGFMPTLHGKDIGA